MLRVFPRRLCEVIVKPAVETVVKPDKKSCSIISRFRAFFGGAFFASAAGMYVISFQLQGLLDEVKSAVHDVAVRQHMIEERLSKLSAEPKNE
jgi:hypothetical protein